jgi:hypothetical protein
VVSNYALNRHAARQSYRGWFAHAGIRGVRKMVIKFIFLAILIEALTELLFKAAPLQGIRNWLIKSTPFLRSEEQGHLLECKYCSSVWIAFGVIILATWFDNAVTRLMAYFIVLARGSNYVHVIFGTIRDFQINLQLKR